VISPIFWVYPRVLWCIILLAILLCSIHRRCSCNWFLCSAVDIESPVVMEGGMSLSKETQVLQVGGEEKVGTPPSHELSAHHPQKNSTSTYCIWLWWSNFFTCVVQGTVSTQLQLRNNIKCVSKITNIWNKHWKNISCFRKQCDFGICSVCDVTWQRLPLFSTVSSRDTWPEPHYTQLWVLDGQKCLTLIVGYLLNQNSPNMGK
jgi:hypothetical protein